MVKNSQKPSADEKQKEARLSWKKTLRILRYLRPYISIEILLVCTMLLGVLLSLIDPLIIKIIIDNVLINSNLSLLNFMALVILLLFIFKAANRVLTSYSYAFVGQRILFDIRHQLYQHIQRLSLGFFSRTRTGEIISRVGNDVNSLQALVTGTVISALTDALTLVFICVIIFFLNWKLAILTIAVIPFFTVTLIIFNKRLRTKSKEVRERVADLLSFFQETISTIRLIKAFAKEKLEGRRHVRKSKKMMNVRIEMSMLGTLAAAVTSFCASMGSVAILWFGGYLVIKGELTIGGLVAFLTYSGRLFGPINNLVDLNITVQTAMASVDRIFEYLDLVPEIRDKEDAQPICITEGTVEYCDLAFFYQKDERHGHMVIEDISFTIRPGETLAIVGPSGSGKSTIANMLMRFYDPTRGSVRIDGTDIRDVKSRTLRKEIGIVSQETLLFNTTIRENLRYGNKKAKDEEIQEAAETAEIHEFIMSLKDGYDTVVGERGVKLSGGEKQRISIARAILKNPKILILDEATSSLDTESEKSIQQSLHKLKEKRTTLMIAHRLSTIVDADTIVVLRKGKIVESGTHHALIENKGFYQQLFLAQFRETSGQPDPARRKA